MSSYSAYRSGMYDRVLRIASFNGVDQSQGDYSGDYGSSPNCKNFISRYDKLYTASGVAQYGATAPTSEYESSDGRLFQGFFRDSSGNDFSRVMLALHGRFYVSDLDCKSWTPLGAGFTTNNWSSVSYRDEDHDWIIFANGEDESQYWDGTSESTFPLHPKQGATSTEEGKELFFSKITLLNERLWGGVDASRPDRIYWSDSFDPENWEFDFTDSSNNGGGFVDIATFDGTRIRAVVNAFDDVLVFKDKSVHRISGTYPGEFSVTQVYGSKGTLAPRTIVYNGSRLYFLSSDGLCCYNGTSVYNLSENGDRKLKDVWARINPSTMSKACAVMMDTIIYLAVPLDGSAINTHVIEYDVSTGIYSIIEYAGVDDWLILRDNRFEYTGSSTFSGKLERLLFLNGDKIYSYGVGYTFAGEPINASWQSPKISCGSISSKKSTGRIYMSIDAQSLTVGSTPSIRITMYSGDKVRSKLIPLKNGVNNIRKRVKIRGRTFSFKLENVNGDPFTINKGMEIRIEEDYD